MDTRLSNMVRAPRREVSSYGPAELHRLVADLDPALDRVSGVLRSLARAEGAAHCSLRGRTKLARITVRDGDNGSSVEFFWRSASLSRPHRG